MTGIIKSIARALNIGQNQVAQPPKAPLTQEPQTQVQAVATVVHEALKSASCTMPLAICYLTAEYAIFDENALQAAVIELATEPFDGFEKRINDKAEYLVSGGLFRDVQDARAELKIKVGDRLRQNYAGIAGERRFNKLTAAPSPAQQRRETRSEVFKCIKRLKELAKEREEANRAVFVAKGQLGNLQLLVEELSNAQRALAVVEKKYFDHLKQFFLVEDNGQGIFRSKVHRGQPLLADEIIDAIVRAGTIDEDDGGKLTFAKLPKDTQLKMAVDEDTLILSDRSLVHELYSAAVNREAQARAEQQET